MTHPLKEACRQLRLSGLASSLDLRVQEATSHQLPHLQFLELLLQDELNVRAQRQLERRKKAASFFSKSCLFQKKQWNKYSRAQGADEAFDKRMGDRRKGLRLNRFDLQ
jgi:hypothetical protein